MKHLFTSILLLLILSTSILRSQNSKITWSSFNMGFAKHLSSNTHVMSVTGQGLIGTSQYQNTQIVSGFFADTLLLRTNVAVRDEDELPKQYLLSQNYPNPFNPSTTIHFELPRAEHVILKVYNLLGEEVVTLIDEEKAAGKYDVRFDASRFTSGVYFYRLVSYDPSSSQSFVSTKKIILIK